MRAEPQANVSADEGASSAERFVLLTAALGAMLAPLNSTMIAVALPGIMEEFDAGVGQAAWLFTAYLAAMASLQPLGGKIGDRVRTAPPGAGWAGVFRPGLRGRRTGTCGRCWRSACSRPSPEG